MRPAKYHRAHLRTALVFACMGSLLGASMLASLCGWSGVPAWTTQLQAHSQLQVYGFCVLFTMGVAHQLLHQVFGKLRGSLWMNASLGLMATGTVWNTCASQSLWLGTAGQLLASLVFLGCVLANRMPGAKQPISVSSHFLRVGIFWLLVSLGWRLTGGSPLVALNLTLWGFLSLYILGVGLKVHGGFLGRASLNRTEQWVLLGMWQVGMLGLVFPVLRGAGDLALLASSLLIHLRLRPLAPVWERVRQRWLAIYLGLSYSWLLAATCMRLGQDLGWSGTGVEGAVRHALASGFILTMIVGMGLRLVPAFEGKELRWHWLPPACAGLLAIGTLLRVLGQSLLGVVGWALWLTPWAGFAQASCVLLFGFALLTVMGPRDPAPGRIS